MDAVSLAVYADFYRWYGLNPECPRAGDLAVVIKDHHNDETGLMVRVANHPVFGSVYCTDCGQRLDEWVVEVALVDDLGKDIPGENVFAYPIKWLQRVLPIGHADASKKQVLTL